VKRTGRSKMINYLLNSSVEECTPDNRN
jgi:hypothetical protein